jgi:hypothetical protein
MWRTSIDTLERIPPDAKSGAMRNRHGQKGNLNAGQVEGLVVRLE